MIFSTNFDHPLPPSVKGRAMPVLPLWAFTACSRTTRRLTRILRTAKMRRPPVFLDAHVTFVQSLDFYGWILNPSNVPKCIRGECLRLGDNTSLPFLE
jgi:hypothetical protein